MDSQPRSQRPTLRRNTRQRQLVLDAVRARCDHPTAEDIFLDVRTIDERVSRGTVYRNLNLLAETGVIATVKAPGAMRFDRLLPQQPRLMSSVDPAVSSRTRLCLSTPLPRSRPRRRQRGSPSTRTSWCSRACARTAPPRYPSKAKN